MRMKEDHMKNGQLKPGYNVQIGCENGFVLGFDVFPNPVDSPTLITHLENMKNRLGKLPERVIADAGYGSEENYAFLETENVDSIIKYSMWQKEQTKAWKKNVWNTDNWLFDKGTDTYECPAGKRLKVSHEKHNKTSSGYVQDIRVYTCEDCMDCALREQCTKSKLGRSIQRNERMLHLKESVKARLASSEGKELMRRRAHEVETVFGQLKANQGFRRFRLKGQEKVSVEWGLLILGYNFKNMAK